ncbi:MAG: hypothetical protein GY775_19925 [Candidatus Scalindua sp.]|nr:hypothetical protein [Candidatus Scalindua sp.]
MITKTKSIKRKASTRPQEELISQAQYARHKSVSRATICKHVMSGKITLVNGKIDPMVADKQLKKSLDITQKRKVKLPDDDVGDELNKYQKARAKREYFNAKLVELEYMKKSGLLILVKDVEDEAQTLYRIFRDQMLNIPNRISSQLSAETDEAIVVKLLKKEIETAITKAF